MALDKFKAPVLPVLRGGSEVDVDYMQQLVRAIEMYFSQLDSKTPNHAEKYTADFFVGGVFYIGQLTVPTRSVTGTVTVADSDFLLLADATGGNVTVNLPAAASSSGRMLVVKKIDASANTVTLDGNSGETIDDAATVVISTRYATFTVICDGSEWWIE